MRLLPDALEDVVKEAPEDAVEDMAGSFVPDGVPGPIRSFSAERGRSCDDAGSLDRSLS